MYSELRRMLSGKHRVIPMEYPGHGMRMRNGLMDSPDRIIDDMFDQMRRRDTGEPFMLLGYSLGAKLTYLLYEKYRDNTMFRRLKGIFFCASSMADVVKTKDYSLLSDEELMEYTIGLGGSDFEDEVDHENFKQFLPVIRNDFILYEYAKKKIAENEHDLIDEPVYIFYSSDEENIEYYDKFCAEAPGYEYFEGGHFFIHDHCDKMAYSIDEKIRVGVIV